MRFKILKIPFVLFAVCLATTAVAQNNVVFTYNPNTNLPELVSEPNANALIHFTSISYDPAGVAVPFTMRFGADFIGKYEPGPSDTPVVTGWDVTFSSTPRPNCPITGGTMPCEEIRIKLTSPAADHPPSGYKYDVEMGGQVLDPRIRGR